MRKYNRLPFYWLVLGILWSGTALVFKPEKKMIGGIPFIPLILAAAACFAMFYCIADKDAGNVRKSKDK